MDSKKIYVMTQEERKLYDAANKYAWDIDSGDLNTNRDSFIAGANWQYEQFEKERLKHCDEMTAEQAQMESDFVVQHLEKYNSTPTYSDAIEYGKNQVIDKACEWLNNFYSEDRHCYLVAEDIEAFKQAMEERHGKSSC